MLFENLKTPIVFFIFKRPDTTQKVFEAIRQVKPSKLLVVADGPRSNKADEEEKCNSARKIIEQIDWKCDVIKNYSDINLGCGKRISSGLDWAFSIVDEAIILEDDCLPHPSFFPYCEELLNLYRDDERIMSICGKNVQFGRSRTENSYYFSQYSHCWGWATWKRAWKYFDYEMSDWETVKSDNLLANILDDSRAVDYWTNVFQSTYEHRHQSASWGYRWLLSSWLQNGLSILPKSNLISNIGFGIDATHTTASSSQSQYANMKVEAMQFPLQHPSHILRNRVADNFEQNTLFNPSITTRAKAKLLRMLGQKTI